jgi:hypothetical protein
VPGRRPGLARGGRAAPHVLWGSAPGCVSCPSNRPANGTNGTAVRTSMRCDKRFASITQPAKVLRDILKPVTNICCATLVSKLFNAYNFSVHHKLAHMFYFNTYYDRGFGQVGVSIMTSSFLTGWRFNVSGFKFSRSCLCAFSSQSPTSEELCM